MPVTRKAASPTIRERKQRRKRFRAALALAGKEAQDFASDVDVTPAHLSMVLSGKRESALLLQKVDAFIALHLPEVAPASAPAA